MASFDFLNFKPRYYKIWNIRKKMLPNWFGINIKNGLSRFTQKLYVLRISKIFRIMSHNL